MIDIAISCENLGKQYRIGQRESYKALRDTLTDALSAPFRRLRSRANDDQRNPNPADKTFWALKDVSFDVRHGEVVGIIGRNGAGKSTLLKILSRITKPTEGQVRIKGRVGSLLEVGTGFHPELTGRENIFLNGTILGMRKREIERKFDEIIAFAEIEKFLDTPVKRYSSGMYVRLAFAVAAYMESEILLVDEVLAVGDTAFQKKCLSKMGDIAKRGRTVLFVSHNMGAINRLCRQGIWLDGGRVNMEGSIEDVGASYLSCGSSGDGERRWTDVNIAPGNEKVKLHAVRLTNSASEVSAGIDIRQPFNIEVEYEVFETLPSVRIALTLLTHDGTIVFISTDTNDHSWDGQRRKPGGYVSRCEMPGNFLNEGQYSISIAADIPSVELFFLEENVLSFQIEQTGGISGRFSEKWPGVICPNLSWQIQQSHTEGPAIKHS